MYLKKNYITFHISKKRSPSSGTNTCMICKPFSAHVKMYHFDFSFASIKNGFNCVDWIGDSYRKIDKGNDIIQGKSKGETTNLYKEQKRNVLMRNKVIETIFLQERNL